MDTKQQTREINHNWEGRKELTSNNQAMFEFFQLTLQSLLRLIHVPILHISIPSIIDFTCSCKVFE